MAGGTPWTTGRILAAMAGLALIVLFFLPWVLVSGSALAALRALLWLTPLAGVGILLLVIFAQAGQGVSNQMTGITTIILGVLSALPTGGLLLETANISLAGFGVGFWGSLLASVVAVFAGLLEMATPKQQPDWLPTTPLPGPGPLAPPPPPTAPVILPPTSGSGYGAPVAVPPTQVVNPPVKALAWLADRSTGRQFGVGEVTNIGRDGASCDVVLDDPHISRKHACIKLEHGQFYLYDLASMGGTYVNNRRVQRQLLYDKDVVQMGTTKLIFVKP